MSTKEENEKYIKKNLGKPGVLQLLKPWNTTKLIKMVKFRPALPNV